MNEARYGRATLRALGALVAAPWTLAAALFGADHFGTLGIVLFSAATATSFGFLLGQTHEPSVRPKATVAYAISAGAVAAFIVIAFLAVVYAFIPQTGC